MGIRPQYAEVSDARQFIEAVNNSNNGIIIDVESVSKVVGENHLDDFATVLRQRNAPVLLFVSNPDQLVDRFIQVATDGAVRGAEILTNCSSTTFCKSSSSMDIELAGHSYRRGCSDGLGLMVNSLTNGRVLMQLNQTPSFIQLQIGTTNVFVWATLDVFDMEQPLAAELEFELATDEYIPAIIFLRETFGKRCWHNPVPGAGMVIDDPLLKANYGFIDFRKLLQSARNHQYRVTLAFIPWNYWRTRRKATQLFRDYSDCFDICAHGCDHTDSEFRHGTYDELLSRNFIAGSRMSAHASRTGMQSQPLMVCPKEQYSTEAMRAFADSRQFMALICTACMPRDLDQPALTGADLLLPAQDSFFGFPVFKRHYSDGIKTGVFAMALFLGKPAILVEHHEFFRNGPAGAEEFARHIRDMRPGLKWTSLQQTVMRTHARRQISTNHWAVRFFTDRFFFEPVPENGIGYTFMRRVPETTRVECVRVAGKEIPFNRKNGLLAFETEVREPGTVLVEVKVTAARPTQSSNGARYQASVALRRGLCEVRDNLVARNRFALNMGRRLMKSLKQTNRSKEIPKQRETLKG